MDVFLPLFILRSLRFCTHFLSAPLSSFGGIFALSTSNVPQGQIAQYFHLFSSHSALIIRYFVTLPLAYWKVDNRHPLIG